MAQEYQACSKARTALGPDNQQEGHQAGDRVFAQVQAMV